MGAVQRWSVTYTKHIKQKRKVYQDGVLEFHTSTQKVMLYDDCEKLLDSRIVKKDEAIKAGETLDFSAYLVDIGDAEGDQKAIPNLDFQGREKKINEKAGPLHCQKFKNTSTSAGDRKINLGKKKIPRKDISPSQKIIREFKKSEMTMYGIPNACLDTTKACATEWKVLYTTQMTQKAKKYHDGILRVATSGSQGRQVTLYDTSRRLLDSRFLKKDEVIRTGESLAFDCHLVDIGETEGVHKPVMDLNVQGRSCNTIGKKGLPLGQQAQYKSSVKNGISELIDSVSPQSCLKTIKTVRGEGMHPNHGTFDVDNIKLGARVAAKKPLRDAHEILFILKKPMTQKGIMPVTKDSVDKCQASQPVGGSNFHRNVLDDCGEETAIKQDSGAEMLNSLATVHNAYSPDMIKSAELENKGESQPKSSTSSSFPLATSIISRPNMDEVCIERKLSGPVSCIEEPQVSDMLELDFLNRSQSSAAPMPYCGSNGSVESGISVELMSSREISSCCGSQFSKELIRENHPQATAENTETIPEWCEGNIACGIGSSTLCNSDPDNVERRSSKEHENPSKLDECPSFDLGF